MLIPSTPPRPPRRWLRLSLRGLMVLVVLIAIPAGWMATTIRTQRQALAMVQAAGGQVRFDFGSVQVGTSRGRPVYRGEPSAPAWLRRWLGNELFQNVQIITFPKPITPDVLAAVAHFDRLETLTLNNSAGTEGGFAALRGLKHLDQVRLFAPGINDTTLRDLAQIASIRILELNRPRTADLSPTPAAGSTPTDAGFAYLAGLANLEILQITYGSNLTDAGSARMLAGIPRLKTFYPTDVLPSAVPATLTALGRHHPDLEKLGLNGTGVTDADLALVAALPRLKTLQLLKTGITDAGLVHLRSLRDLTALLIAVPGVTDDGLRSLSDLTQLDQLLLSDSKVSDAGLVHLTKLPKLKRLDLNKTLVTNAGMAMIAQIKSLEQLRLSALPGLTDAGLIPLRTLPNLKLLEASATKVTPDGIAALKQALPTLSQVITQAPRRIAPRPATAPKPL